MLPGAGKGVAVTSADVPQPVIKMRMRRAPTIEMVVFARWKRALAVGGGWAVFHGRIVSLIGLSVKGISCHRNSPICRDVTLSSLRMVLVSEKRGDE